MANDKMQKDSAVGKSTGIPRGALIGIIVVLIAVIAFAGYLLLKPNRAELSGSANLVVDETNADSILSDMQNEVEEGMYTVKMNSQWTFPDGKSESKDAYVANAAENRKAVYFEVILQDTSQKVFTSPTIPTGSAIQGFALDKKLAKGEYLAYCNYHLINEDGSEFSTLAVEVTLNISK